MADEGGGGPNQDARIRTFLIADVRGYTVFTQERGDEAATKLAARFAGVTREIVEGHGGSVIELRGDEALAVFDSSRQAIRCAAALQQRFLEETEADPTLPLRVGIGLDAGEAVPLESGFRGGALNLAARLCGQAGPGEILLSQGVVHLARKVEGIRLIDRGALHLKGLEDPVHVFRAVAEAGDPAEGFRRFAPPPAKRGPLVFARKHPVVAAIVVLALAAAVVIPATYVLRGGTERVPGNAVARIDTGGRVVRGSVALDSRPGDIAVGAGGVWVTLPDRGQVKRIDPATMTIRNTIPVGAAPAGIAIGGGSVWVANSGSATVSRISPEREAVIQTIDVPGGPSAIVVHHSGVWVASTSDDSVSHIDPTNGNVTRSIAVGDEPVAVAADQRGLWVANAASGSVSRVDPKQAFEVAQITVGDGPEAIASGPSGVWVANAQDGTVSRIDPNTHAVRQKIDVGGAPGGIALDGPHVWVSDASDGSVSRIDPGAGSVARTSVGDGAGGVDIGGRTLWLSLHAAEASHRGGTFTATAAADVMDTTDPAVAYQYLSWNILSTVRDGLVGFRRTGGLRGAALVPNLASAIPRPTNEGKTYSFAVRPGIRYSDGTRVRAADFRRAIERVFATADATGTPSGGKGYYAGIVGADACATGKRCDLSRGIVTDDTSGTVTFNLTAPDPNFLYALALPFATAVPSGTSDAYATTIPATGPYIVERFDQGKQVVLARNTRFRSWSRVARPDGFPDRIVWRLDTGDGFAAKEVTDVIGGKADLMWLVPPDQYARVAVGNAAQVYLPSLPGVFYMAMNTKTPPFDDVRVRRAVNFAIDRNVTEELFKGFGTTTCQILPPGFPGRTPYCPYTINPGGAWTKPDLATARKLIAQAGARGAPVTVWTSADYYAILPLVPLGRYFVTLLNSIGLRATLKVVSGAVYGPAHFDPARRVQMAFDAWSADYPAEPGFINSVLTCSSTLNVAQFCDPALERAMTDASNVQFSDANTSHRRWASVEHRLVDLAPWVPLISRTQPLLLSDRVGNYQFNIGWGPLVDQMWVR